MCMDYTDINKVCPKDPFSLPHIDQVVDSTAGCDLLCFFDAYSGYHKVSMAREDEEKTLFTTPVGTYCYVRIDEPMAPQNISMEYSSSTLNMFQGRRK